MEILNSNQFGKLNIESLEQFETSNEIVFPDDYKSFLIEHNGGIPSFNIVPSVKTDVQVLFGMHSGPYWANFFDHVDMYQDRIPSWYIPIGRDSGGNLFIMSLWKGNHGLVAFWRHEDEAKDHQNANEYFENVTFIADSFHQFLNQLVGGVQLP